MSLVSVILNVDTRPICNEFTGMWNGVRSRDFLTTPGLLNKRNFFKGHDIELIVFVDEHQPLNEAELYALRTHADCVVIRKHSKYYRGANPFYAFNDLNYHNALSLARGEYVCHFDQDMAAFSSDESTVQFMKDEVDSGRHKFVCYPSPSSPNPCEAPSYQGKFWASTRMFFCKRETLILDDLERSIRDNEFFFEKYGKPPVVNPWTEAFIAGMADYSVLYPKVEIEKWCAFPWKRYTDGTLERLNSMSHSDVAQAVNRCGGWGIFWDGADSTLMFP